MAKTSMVNREVKRKKLAKKFAARDEQVTLGAGSGELLTNAVRAFTSPSRPLVTAWPSFEAPRDTAKKIGTPVREVGFDAALRIDLAKLVEASKGAGLVFFCNPNNPTATVHGQAAVADTVKAIRAASPDTVILLDEVMAELDVQRRADLLKYVGESEQVLFTTTDLNLFAPEFVEKAEVWKVESGKVEK